MVEGLIPFLSSHFEDSPFRLSRDRPPRSGLELALSFLLDVVPFEEKIFSAKEDPPLPPLPPL